MIDRWLAVAGPGAGPVGRDLLARYAEPHRHYHDQRHLAEVLDALDLLGGGPSAQLAAWFHDAVYDPRRSDNEDRSAELAAELLTGHRTPTEITEVARLVRLTASHQPAADDPDGALLCDADLSVLGATATRYQEYAAAVRQEYGHLPDGAFDRGRAAILNDLLARPAIYRTAAGSARWEQAARANLRRELGDPGTHRTGSGPS